MKLVHTFLPALVAGALLVAGCGDSDNSTDTASPSAGNSVDRAFVADMVPHHESAVQMAQIAQRRGSSAFVKQLANDIVRTQNAEIATMQAADQRLQAAGVTKGSLGESGHTTGKDDPSKLNGAKPFDRAFLKMMLPHHEGAVVIAKAELDKGGDKELKTLAQSIITAQEREISQMRTHLGDDPGTDEEHGVNDPGHSG